MKKIVLAIAAAAILAACAAHHSNGGNELYGEIKGASRVGHTPHPLGKRLPRRKADRPL